MKTIDSRFSVLMLLPTLWLLSVGSIQAADAIVLTTVHTFNSIEGLQPSSGLVQDAAGTFYGTNASGGANNDGTIFKITTDGTCTVLHAFDGTDGVNPDAALVAGTDGNFYGTTPLEVGPSVVFGSIFKVTPAGDFTVLHRFGPSETGSPGIGLVLGADGSFYGIASGGANYIGMVFRITPQGDYSVVHSFTSSEGAAAAGPLLLGRDGNFYGTTIYQGLNGFGTFYSLTPAGTLTVIYSFEQPVSSYAGLVEGADGVFYGTSLSGGNYLSDTDGYAGSVFRITAAGEYTVLHRFGGRDGIHLRTPLTLGADGNFYGTSEDTIFRITPEGVLTSLTTIDVGSGLLNALTVENDGTIYGTYFSDSSSGGSSVFYRLTDARIPSSFFASQVPVGDGYYFLNYDATEAAGSDFGFYCYFDDRHYIYHLQLGYEYVIDAVDGANGVFFYDFKSRGFFYTSPSFPYPYMYDFSLNSIVYHYGTAETVGSTEPDSSAYRYFYVFNTGEIILK